MITACWMGKVKVAKKVTTIISRLDGVNVPDIANLFPVDDFDANHDQDGRDSRHGHQIHQEGKEQNKEAYEYSQENIGPARSCPRYSRSTPSRPRTRTKGSPWKVPDTILAMPCPEKSLEASG